jgi:hypothetical protein
MTVNDAIEALERARLEVGGEAPLLMVDGLQVVEFPLGDCCVYVSDSPQPEPPEMSFETDLGTLVSRDPWRGDGEDELCFGLEGHPVRRLLVRSVTVRRGGKTVLQADLTEPFPVPAGEVGIWWHEPTRNVLGYLANSGQPYRYDPPTGRVRPITHTAAGLVQFYADGGGEVFHDGR